MNGESSWNEYKCCDYLTYCYKKGDLRKKYLILLKNYQQSVALLLVYL